MIGGKGVNDPALVETLCSNSADAIDWLGEQGITLNSVSSAGGASVKRIHRPVNEEARSSPWVLIWCPCWRRTARRLVSR